jgi:tRNA (cytidine56-2'-O)-methyltransferase
MYSPGGYKMGSKTEVHVLRLDHRRRRDARITTHVCLTARALGASGVFLSGDQDEKLMENVRDVVRRWGGDFQVSYQSGWEKFMEDWKKKEGKVIHLTMYGEPVQDVLSPIKESSGDKLVVVGGSRVPSQVYQKADWNVGITSQPHSEISSLALFLHLFFKGQELELEFKGEEIRVLPSPRGKKVLIRDDSRQDNMKDKKADN